MKLTDEQKQEIRKEAKLIWKVFGIIFIAICLILILR